MTLESSGDTRRRRARIAAAGVCGLEALVLAGFAVFYLVELPSVPDDARTRVVTEMVLIVIGAAGTALLARLWRGRSGWPVTPTVVWHLLLVPVTVAMFQSGQLLIASGLAVAILLAVAAAALSGRDDEDDADEPSHSGRADQDSAATGTG